MDDKTFFTDLQRYPQPNSEGQYELEDVLSTATAFLPFFDVFGTLLKICKNDMVGNIAKLTKHSSAVPQAKTFKQLLEYELANGLSKKSDSACIAALWFKRSLQFIIAFLEAFHSSEDAESKEVFNIAYEATLKRYHGWIVQKAISVVSNMLPYRKNVIKNQCFGVEGLDAKLVADQKDYLSTMKPLTDYLHNLIVDLGLDSEAKA